MHDLPVIAPVCPAALPVAGATPERGGVVCRVMEQDRKRDAGTGITAAASGLVQHGPDGVFLSVEGDPSTVFGLCCGDALPVLHDEGDQRRASPTYCPVWQAEKDRIRARRRMLTSTPEPEPVSMGLESPAVESTREALDELAPPKAA